MSDAFPFDEAHHRASIPRALHHNGPADSKAQTDPIEVSEGVPHWQDGVEHIIRGQQLAASRRLNSRQRCIVSVQYTFRFASRTGGKGEIAKVCSPWSFGQTPPRSAPHL